MNEPAVAAALKPLQEALAADGYDLVVDGIRDGSISLRVLAGPNACADCLIPRPLFEQMVASVLMRYDPSLASVTVDVAYPTPPDGSTSAHTGRA